MKDNGVGLLNTRKNILIGLLGLLRLLRLIRDRCRFLLYFLLLDLLILTVMSNVRK